MSTKQAGRKGRRPAGIRGEAVRDYDAIKLRLPPTHLRRLDLLARTLGVCRWRVVASALDEMAIRLPQEQREILRRLERSATP